MMFIVAILNRVFTLLFGVVYFPLKWLGPFWSLLAISGLAGLLLVWIFGKVSNQDARMYSGRPIMRAFTRLFAGGTRLLELFHAQRCV